MTQSQAIAAELRALRNALERITGAPVKFRIWLPPQLVDLVRWADCDPDIDPEQYGSLLVGDDQ